MKINWGFFNQYWLCSKILSVVSVHKLHAWRLNQSKAIASVHIVTNDFSLLNFMMQAECIDKCLHVYSIHFVTLQPELMNDTGDIWVTVTQNKTSGLYAWCDADSICCIACKTDCESLMCCNWARSQYHKFSLYKLKRLKVTQTSIWCQCFKNEAYLQVCSSKRRRCRQNITLNCSLKQSEEIKQHEVKENHSTALVNV